MKKIFWNKRISKSNKIHSSGNNFTRLVSAVSQADEQSEKITKSVVIRWYKSGEVACSVETEKPVANRADSDSENSELVH